MLHALHKKNTARKKAHCKDGSAFWEKFQRLHNELKYLVRFKCLSYLKVISDSCFSQLNRFWSSFNFLSKRSSVPDTVELDRSAFSDADDKATAFNNYFASIFNDDLSLHNSLPSAPFTDKLLELVELSNVDVLSALNLLNPTKTPGLDNLHPNILKECAAKLAPSLCQSFWCGRLLPEWKCANMCPLQKMGPRTNVTNYRQSSLLSIVSKLCKRCVFSKLITKLADLLSALQHGFV